MSKSITDWKLLGEKAKGKPGKRCMDGLLDDMKLIRMKNWKNNKINREISHKFVEKAKTHRGL